MDFSIGNELEFSKSIATGEVRVPSSFIRTYKSLCNHDFCKANVLLQLAEQYSLELENIIAIGDSENDICLIRESGIGVAFRASNKYLNLVADRIISEKSFLELLDIAK